MFSDNTDQSALGLHKILVYMIKYLHFFQFKKTTKVDVTPEALDVRNTHIITDPATHSFDIKNNSLPKLCATEDTFTIHGVKTTPAILTKDYSKKFEVRIRFCVYCLAW